MQKLLIQFLVMVGLIVFSYYVQIEILENHYPSGKRPFGYDQIWIGLALLATSVAVAVYLTRMVWSDNKTNGIIFCLGVLICLASGFALVDTVDRIERNNDKYYANKADKERALVKQKELERKQKEAAEKRRALQRQQEEASRVRAGDTAYLCRTDGTSVPVYVIQNPSGGSNMQIEPHYQFIIGNWLNNKSHYPGSYYWFSKSAIEKYSSDC